MGENFTILKILQAPNFHDFRKHFRAKLGRIFLVPADSFDNVKGKFPIGFHIWKTAEPSSFDHIIADVYNHDAQYIGPKTICYYDNDKTINDWIIKTRNQPHERPIGFMSAKGCDFQNVNYLYILNTKKQLPHPRGTIVTSRNLIEISIYFAVRKCIEATWINDRDQFLYPNDKWISDIEFQHDCLTYTLFNNNIQGHVVIGNLHYYNDWIPYTEDEVGAKDCFTSHFMSDYLSGKYQTNALFGSSESRPMHLKFSTEATAVLDAGRELWRYYHSHEDSCPDASLYDIKLYFQGIKMLKNGKMQMNSESEDLQYKSLIKILRERLKVLALKISPKIYEYGFLRK